MTAWIICSLAIAVPGWLLVAWIHWATTRDRKSRFSIEP